MAGVVKVFVESDTGSLIERRAGQVQRVVLRQLQREEDLSISASPDVADNEQLAKVEMSFGGFPKSVERKTLDSDLLYFEFHYCQQFSIIQHYRHLIFYLLKEV